MKKGRSAKDIAQELGYETTKIQKMKEKFIASGELTEKEIKIVKTRKLQNRKKAILMLLEAGGRDDEIARYVGYKTSTVRDETLKIYKKWKYN